jgi:hypothetical protein
LLLLGQFIEKSMKVLVSAIHPPVTLAMHSEGLVCIVSFGVGIRIA